MYILTIKKTKDKRYPFDIVEKRGIENMNRDKVYTIKKVTYEEVKENVFDKFNEEQINFLKIMRYWYKYPKKLGYYTMFGYYNEYPSKNSNIGYKLLNEINVVDYSIHNSRIEIEGDEKFYKITGSAWTTEAYYFIEFVYSDIAEYLIKYLEEEHGRKVKHIKYPYKRRKFGSIYKHELKHPFVEIKDK